jgi:hypothetical protein
MADDEGEKEMRDCVADGLAKFVLYEAEEERQMQAQPAQSPPVKRQKRVKRPSLNGIFLQALLENAPTQQGKQFIMEDIYWAIKGNGKDAGEDKLGLVKQDEEEETQEVDKAGEREPIDEFHSLSLLAEYYENLLILPSKFRGLKFPDFAVMARLTPANTDTHPSRQDDLDNQYYPDVESANRSHQAVLKEKVIPSSTVTDIPRR